MTSESETLLSKTITYSVSFRDFSIFARIHGAEDIREESTEVLARTDWSDFVCRFSDDDDRIECDALSSRRIVRHKPPLSAVVLSVGHSVLGGSDRMPDPCDQAPLEYVPNAGI